MEERIPESVTTFRYFFNEFIVGGNMIWIS